MEKLGIVSQEFLIEIFNEIKHLEESQSLAKCYKDKISIEQEIIALELKLFSSFEKNSVKSLAELIDTMDTKDNNLPSLFRELALIRGWIAWETKTNMVERERISNIINMTEDQISECIAHATISGIKARIECGDKARKIEKKQLQYKGALEEILKIPSHILEKINKMQADFIEVSTTILKSHLQ